MILMITIPSLIQIGWRILLIWDQNRKLSIFQVRHFFTFNYVIKNVGVCFVKVLLDFLPTVALKIVSWWALKMVGCN